MALESLTIEEAKECMTTGGEIDDLMYVGELGWHRLLIALGFTEDEALAGRHLVLDIATGQIATAHLWQRPMAGRADGLFFSGHPMQGDGLVSRAFQQDLSGERWVWRGLRENADIPAPIDAVSAANQRYVVDIQPGAFAMMYFQTGVRLTALVDFLESEAGDD